MFQDFYFFLHHLIFKKAVKIFSESLATIEQYRISFNRNIMVVNDHFIREGHTTFNCMKSDMQTQLNKNISLL